MKKRAKKTPESDEQDKKFYQYVCLVCEESAAELEQILRKDVVWQVRVCKSLLF